MENLYSIIVNIVFTILGIVIVAGMLVRIFKDKFAKVTRIAATVVNKQHYEKHIYSKSEAPSSQMKYVVTFDTDMGEMHFEVTGFSYNGYRLNEKGTLTYKGTRLIDFK